MTAPTHRQYSVTFAFLANIILYKYGVTSINYYLALMLMLLLSKAGAIFPDIDHSWKNVKEKTVPNLIMNKLIHLTGGKHRSWQTHSIDIVIWAIILSMTLPILLYNNNYIDDVNREVLTLIMLGFTAGWISHIFSDMLTSAGVKVICFLPFKASFVPKHIGKLRFNTGNEWEAFCYRSTKIINIMLGLISLAYPLIANGYITSLINKYIL